MPFEHVRRLILETPWAIHPRAFEAMLEVLELRLEGKAFSPEERRERIEAVQRPRQGGRRRPGVAVLPLRGLIAHRAGGLEEVSGGTSTEQFTADFRRAIADDTVDAVVLDVDSPGGSVHGVEELANVIYAARGSKPIVAVANAWAASAAYWIASQADELVVTPSGEVGSIGVIAAHDDLSKAADKAGIKRTFVTAGKHKAEGNEFEPLSADARKHLQGRVDDYYDAFTRAVARGRGVRQSTVKGESFGQGRMLGAGEAFAAGLVDRIAPFDATLARVAAGRVLPRPRAAALSQRRSLAALKREQREGLRRLALRRIEWARNHPPTSR